MVFGILKESLLSVLKVFIDDVGNLLDDFTAQLFPHLRIGGQLFRIARDTGHLNLAEAVLDMNEGMRTKLIEVENIIKGRPLAERLQIAIDEMVAYLFDLPEISNITIFRYFTKNRHESNFDKRLPEFISDIAYSMGLSEDRSEATPSTKMMVLTIINSIHNFVSGESFFLPMLGISREESRVVSTPSLKDMARTLMNG